MELPQRYSPNVVEGEFSEVRRLLCIMEHIHSPKTGVCCLRYVAS
jgi:hypothetical protein